MKKCLTVTIVFITLLLLVSAAGCVDSSSGQKTLRVGVGDHYAPWAYPDENGEYIGFDVESIKWIGAQNNMEVEIVPLTWANIIDNVADGTVDVVYCGLTITETRAEVVDFSMPYMMVNRGIAVHADSSLTKEEVLSGNVLVAAVGGGTNYQWVVSNLPETSVKPLANIDLAFAELEAGRVDAIIFDEVTVNKYIRSGPFKLIGIIEANEQYGVGIRKGDTETMELFNEWIPKLRTSLEWQTLHTKYNIPYD